MSMVTCLIASPLKGQSPHWRGPNQNGHFKPGQYPRILNKETQGWVTPLPGKGTSTPIIVDKSIFLTCPSDGMDAILAFDLQGKALWSRAFGKEVPGKHRNGSGCNASPASDGEHLFVYYKSGLLAALDLNGKVQWKHDLVAQFGPSNLYWDHGTSPVITHHGVVMTRMHEGESWLVCYDRPTGSLLWKVARNYQTPTEGDHGYSTPIITQMNGEEVILVWGAQHLTAHDPVNGEVLWTCGNFNPKNVAFWPAVATPVLIGDVAVVPFGRADKRQPRLHGIRLAGSGDVTASNRLWKTDKHSSFVPSPTSNGTFALVLSDRGVIACIEPSSGKETWRLELPKHRSSFYASPSVAGNLLYAAREDGTVFVVDITGTASLASEQHLGERLIASPVAFENRIILRGEKNLMCYVTR